MMITGSHCKGSKTSHNIRKDVMVKDINRMIQEEYDRELVDIGLQLIRLEMLLQKEHQRYGWIMKNKNLRWKLLQVKLQQMMSIILKEDLRIAKSNIDVLICEPEHGPLLGEYVSEDDEERLIESLMDSVEITNQLMEEMVVRPNETKRSYIF